jgi:hypothetical protein
MLTVDSRVVQLGSYTVEQGQSSVSGLSSGAFMTVQLHLAYSSSFAGAGIIAGGPFRCAESFRAAALLAQDAYVQGALYICMNPLSPQTGPDADRLAQLARGDGRGGRDRRRRPSRGRPCLPLHRQRRPGRLLRRGGAHAALLRAAGREARTHLLRRQRPGRPFHHHRQPEDSQLAANQPPYINRGGFVQSHDILRHIHGPLKAPSQRLTGRLVRFDQTEFFGAEPRASMSEFGYAYVPRAVEQGAAARVHIALHGCKQGYNYVKYVNGRPDSANQPPYGNRYITTTGLQPHRRQQQLHRRLSASPGQRRRRDAEPRRLLGLVGLHQPHARPAGLLLARRHPGQGHPRHAGAAGRLTRTSTKGTAS